MSIWTPRITSDGKPLYRGLADAIAEDVEAGQLKPGDRLPAQRRVAELLDMDLTTASRGYAEAQSRGLIRSRIGQGTFVAERRDGVEAEDTRRRGEVDLTMNLPPEPDDPALKARMMEGMHTVAAELTSLLRYQASEGAMLDRQAARQWLAQRGLDVEVERVAVTSGANATIFAVLGILAPAGGVVLAEGITYPGAQAIARRCGCRLAGIGDDADGIMPDALEGAIREHRPCALYLNPTLNNPTTRTMPLARRQEIAEVLRRHKLPLIEDDAYGFLAVGAPPPLASLVPELSWHVGGLAKIFGGGLRLAFTVSPNVRCAYELGQMMKTTTVMPPMLSAALMTRWIEDGTAELVRNAVREESAARQAIAQEVLGGGDMEGHSNALNVWLKLPEGIGRADVVARLQGLRIGVLPSDPFVVAGPKPEAIRVGLGGPVTQEELRADLSRLANTLSTSVWYG